MADITKIALVSLILYTVTCFVLGYFIENIEEDVEELSPNKNLVRASYPNYEKIDPNYARKIFSDYSAPSSDYKSFTGYRRKPYSGEAVIINELGFRNSINHSMNDSVWFLGGSTMWGTGSDDDRTIPSYFAKITDKKVLNLGESGYNSFQELIQLQMLLAQGLKPKAVVFYDGNNDGNHFCKKDNLPQLRHAYTSRFSRVLSGRKGRLEERKKEIIDFSALSEFYLQPIALVKALKELQAAKDYNISENVSIGESKPTKKDHYCDESEFVKNAARITVSAWGNAYSILNSANIPVYFVLQPMARYQPHRYELNHLVNAEKQLIIDGSQSFQNFYGELKKQFYEKCPFLGSCSSFIDLSEIFFDLEEPIFIDKVHISPNGNHLVAMELSKLIDF